MRTLCYSMGNKNSTWTKVAMDIIINDGLNYVFWKIKLTSGWGVPGEWVVHNKKKIDHSPIKNMGSSGLQV